MHHKCILEVLRYSFEDPSDSLQNVLHRNPSLQSVWEVVWQSTSELIMELQERLHPLGSAEQVDAEDVNVSKAVASYPMSTLINTAWVAFGPVFLEKTETTIMNDKEKP